MNKKILPDFYLERYLLDELSEAKKKEIGKKIIENPAIKKRYEELKESNKKILNKYQPGIYSEKIKYLYNLQKQKKRQPLINSRKFSKNS